MSIPLPLVIISCDLKWYGFGRIRRADAGLGHNGGRHASEASIRLVRSASAPPAARRYKRGVLDRSCCSCRPPSLADMFSSLLIEVGNKRVLVSGVVHRRGKEIGDRMGAGRREDQGTKAVGSLRTVVIVRKNLREREEREFRGAV